MVDGLAPLVERLGGLRDEVGKALRVRWATVTALAPLRIRFDGELDPMSTTPTSAVGALAVGDRVLVARQGSTATVVQVQGSGLLRSFPDRASLDLWSAPDGAQAVADNRVYVRAGGVWRPATPGAPFASAQGQVSITPVANTVMAISITFPVGRFTVAPRGYANARTARPDICQVNAGSESTSGMTIYAFRENTSAYSVGWSAVQMMEDSADG